MAISLKAVNVLQVSEIELGTEILMAVSAIGIIILVVWYSRRLKREALEEEAAGIQVVQVIIEETFKPAIVIAKVGRPLRLNFTRSEVSPCGDVILIPAFGQRLRLTMNQMVTVEITPDKRGEYEFTCGANIPKGKLIVEPS